MANWQSGKLTKCQVDKLASCQNGKLTKWQVDKVASWQSGKWQYKLFKNIRPTMLKQISLLHLF